MHLYLTMVLGNVCIFPFSIKGWGGGLKKRSIHLSDLIVVNKNSLFNTCNLLCGLPLSKFWGMGEGVYLSHVDSSRSFWGNSSLQSLSSINFFYNAYYISWYFYINNFFVLIYSLLIILRRSWNKKILEKML